MLWKISLQIFALKNMLAYSTAKKIDACKLVSLTKKHWHGVDIDIDIFITSLLLLDKQLHGKKTISIRQDIKKLWKVWQMGVTICTNTISRYTFLDAKAWARVFTKWNHYIHLHRRRDRRKRQIQLDISVLSLHRSRYVFKNFSLELKKYPIFPNFFPNSLIFFWPQKHEKKI